MDTNELHILMVEDDDIDRLYVRRLMERSDTTIHLLEARTLAHARDLLSSSTFDCVLLDLNLPDGSGLDLLPHLKEVAVVVFTADTIDHSSTLLKRGVQDYMPKGTFKADALMRSIRYAINRKEALNLKRRVQQESRFASLGRLAASMAHEINNPNTVVTSNLSLLEEALRDWEPFVHDLRRAAAQEPTGAAAQLAARYPDLLDMTDMLDMVSESLASVSRVTEIVRQLRTLARNNTQERETLVDLNELAKHALLIAEGQIPRHANHTLDLTEPLPPIKGRRSRLAQMLTHIVVNAAQALRDPDLEAHHFTLTTRATRDAVTLSVRDTGVGVPPDLAARVFDPFFTTRPLGDGLGLGLTLAQEVVLEHNGQITLHSTPGEGTEVTVTLPVIG